MMRTIISSTKWWLTTMTIIMAWMLNQTDGNKEEIIEDPRDMTDNDNKDE